jgi:uncharacterized protein (TIGR03435 family)
MNLILPILEALMNSLWQAAIVAGLVWLALRFLPRFGIDLNAATRYAIWWAALAVVLVLPIAPAMLRALRPRPPAAAQKAAATRMLAPVPAPPVEPVIITVTPERTARWPLAVVAVWAAILLFRLGQITRSYFYLRGVKRRADVSPIALPAARRRADLLISRDIASPMAVGFARPAVVLPESLLGELSEPEREHVLLHEMAHLAGYDDWSNLAMRILGAALALHPVAVWILRRIEREREMVCDDWVVARTSDARPYAATLARLFELRWSRQKGAALAPGLFGRGTRVGDRIEVLLRRGRKFSPRVSGGGIAASAVFLAITMFAGSLAPQWIAFGQAPEKLDFEVASIKLAAPNDDGLKLYWLPGGRFFATNATVNDLAGFAWDVRSRQISGGPGWTGSDKYNIEAKADPATKFPEGFAAASPFRAMVRSLLEERFKLALHHGSREESIYELRVMQGGTKLAESKNAFPQGLFPGRGRVDGKAAPISLLARYLAGPAGRVVVDKTGLPAKYDFTLSWTPDSSPLPRTSEGADGERATDPDGPSIFTALQEQLGLKLQSARGPVEVLVIDHAEKPDVN